MKRISKTFAALIVGLVVVMGLGVGPRAVFAFSESERTAGTYCLMNEYQIEDGSCSACPEGSGNDGNDVCVTYDTSDDGSEATSDGTEGISDTSDGTEGISDASTTTTSTSAAHALTNPLGSTDLRVVIGYIIKALLGLSGAIALFVFVWSGMMMMLAAGDAKKIATAKASLTWATIGLVVIFTSYTLVYTLITALSTGT
jgi:hypothetical protein